MKKGTLLGIILGTIGKLVFAIGICMCLIQKWDLFEAGVIMEIIGVLILLCTIPIYRSNHSKKIHKKVNWGLIFTMVIGVIGALVMGFGMSKIMVDDPGKTDLLIGIGTGTVGFLVCGLGFPIYSYLKGNKE